MRIENEIEMMALNKKSAELSAEAQTLLQIKHQPLPNGGKPSLPSLIPIANSFILDHAENADMLEEDSVDRLWLVVRSLKNTEGKYVSCPHDYH